MKAGDNYQNKTTDERIIILKVMNKTVDYLSTSEWFKKEYGCSKRENKQGMENLLNETGIYKLVE